MKVIGFQKKVFKFDDGTQVDGINIFLVEARKGVTGVACERVSCSMARLGDYVPMPNDEVNIIYNRFGKVDRIELVSAGK